MLSAPQRQRMLIFGFLACFASAFGQTFFIALFNAQWRLAFDLSHGEIGGLYSLATVCSAFAMIYVGRRLDDVALIPYTTLAVLAFAGGCALAAGAANAGLLLAAIFFLRLGGQGLMGHIAVASMARYFEQRRGRAVAIATLGFPAGEALLPYLVVLGLTVLEWRALWWLAAMVLLVVILPALVWLPRGNPHVHLDSMEKLGGASRSEVLQDWRFHAILPVILAPPFIITGLFFHQVTLAEHQQWSIAWLASAFVVYAICQTGSSLLTGALIDRLGARNLMRYYLLPMAAGMLLLPTFDADWVAFAYMGLLGITAGANGALGGALWAELYGTRHIGAIRALHTALMVFSTAASPILLGLALDSGWTMTELATVMGIYALFAGPLLGGAVRSHRPSSHSV